MSKTDYFPVTNLAQISNSSQTSLVTPPAAVLLAASHQSEYLLTAVSHCTVYVTLLLLLYQLPDMFLFFMPASF